MKRTAALILALMLALLCLPAYGETVSVSAPEVKNAELPPFSVRWERSNDYYILIAAWQENGHDLELCVTGLPEKLTDGQIRLLLNAVRQGKTAVLSGSGLIDAEKTTHNLPLTNGIKLFTDSDADQWPDSLHCWASSVSDMLELTGWIRYAAETDTGRTFGNEDDLFGFFNRAFVNDGAFQGPALEWVFTGADSMRLAPRREGFSGPVIRQYADRKTLLDLRADDYAALDDYMEVLCERLALLKDGAALGAALSLCNISYPLKSDPDIYVGYNPDIDCFEWYENRRVSWSEVTDTLFVPDARTGLLIPVEKRADGCYYQKTDGARVSKNAVWSGKLVYDSGQDLWFSIDQYYYYDDTDDPEYTRQVLCGADEVDLTRPILSPQMSGSDHAVTIMGYAMDLSETEPARRIRAIILADSDNDANLFQVDENTVPREDRPNTYTLYSAETIPVGQEETVSLYNYQPYRQTLLFGVTALMPAPDNDPDPPPKTGDPFPAAAYAAAMLLSAAAAGIILLRRPVRGNRGR
ncbi:MAG: hypothetical protein Q4G19_03355 [Clostridia bacterium]|nr:hypothetical protein [Clostridia bacterium]